MPVASRVMTKVTGPHFTFCWPNKGIVRAPTAMDHCVGSTAWLSLLTEPGLGCVTSTSQHGGHNAGKSGMAAQLQSVNTYMVVLSGWPGHWRRTWRTVIWQVVQNSPDPTDTQAPWNMNTNKITHTHIHINTSLHKLFCFSLSFLNLVFWKVWNMR